MQPSICASFRSRCLSRGYEQVSIKRCRENVYLVSALEPLCGFYVSREMSLEEMYHFFR